MNSPVRRNDHRANGKWIFNRAVQATCYAASHAAYAPLCIMPTSVDQHGSDTKASAVKPLHRVAMWVAGMMFLLVVWALWMNPTSRDQVTPQASAYRVNINQADENKLSLLPNVGQAVARNIIDYRYEHDGFTEPGQIKAVHFIGPVTQQAVAPWVVVE